ncbi:MAG: AtpZ/AtpI family protein [Balneolaceae bacterium]
MFRDPKLRHYLEYLTLGGEIAIGLSAPIFLGYWMDGWLKTTPWFLLTGILIGVLLMIRIVFRLIRSTGTQDS